MVGISIGQRRRMACSSALVLALLVAAGASCAKSPGPGAGASPSIITLDSPNNLNTFTLAPDASAKLTSSQAFDAFLENHRGFQFSLSDATSVQLGYLTAAVGDGTYNYKDRLAYGYTFDTPGMAAHELPTDSPVSNTWWVFLDANTGEMLQSEWQLGA